ncbi:hypothetical protein GWL_05350 [Herbaspirillum sp. GW103]|nr:hypothetical protein GWL_05350 [Herbaspirillum sp. GW103]
MSATHSARFSNGRTQDEAIHADASRPHRTGQPLPKQVAMTRTARSCCFLL